MGGPHALLAGVLGDFHEIRSLTAVVLLRRIGWQSIFVGPNVSFEMLKMVLRRKQAQLMILGCNIEPGRRNATILAEGYHSTSSAIMCRDGWGTRIRTVCSSSQHPQHFPLLTESRMSKLFNPELVFLTSRGLSARHHLPPRQS